MPQNSSAFKGLISPSGGLFYHGRALRMRNELWLPFRTQLRTWIEAWNITDKNRPLILVGPSAGWCLPIQWILNFSEVLIVEPDPLARKIFRWRLSQRKPSLTPQILPNDFFFSPQDPWNLSRLNVFFAKANAANAALLFCNVLGQLQYTLNKTKISHNQSKSSPN